MNVNSNRKKHRDNTQSSTMKAVKKINQNLNTKKIYKPENKLNNSLSNIKYMYIRNLKINSFR